MTTASFSNGEHSDPTCSMIAVHLCPSDKSLYGERPDEHWWSGWPGAYCLKCHTEDPIEACMGGCECSCHEEFWEEAGIELMGMSEVDDEVDG